jgi:hypothetical protein
MRAALNLFLLTAAASALAAVTLRADAAELSKPGSSAAEVRAEMGLPTAIHSAPGKKQVWEYAGKPSPYETFLLVFSKGRLTVIRQIITDATFAQVKAGMRQHQVRALLGTPWRITNVNDDADEDIGDVWEYRGQDAGETYKFHIEYDLNRRVVLAAKVPDVAINDHGGERAKPAASTLPKD